MREIKFRGKKEFDGSITNMNEWIYGYLYKIGRYYHIYTNTGQHCNIIPETVGQYTGLKDCNGKEIYEGDIVKDKHGFYKKVSFNSSAFILQDHGVFYWLHEYEKEYIPLHINIEVIGNIHDNHELLEGI